MITITAITFIVLFFRCRSKKNKLLLENEALKAEINKLNLELNALKNAQKA